MRGAALVAVALVVWVVATAAVPGVGVDVLVVLWLLGLLVLRELAGSGLLEETRARVDLLIVLGLVAFAVVVVERVRAILGG